VHIEDVGSMRKINVQQIIKGRNARVGMAHPLCIHSFNHEKNNHHLFTQNKFSIDLKFSRFPLNFASDNFVFCFTSNSVDGVYAKYS
jgi:hypothetical protein